MEVNINNYLEHILTYYWEADLKIILENSLLLATRTLQYRLDRKNVSSIKILSMKYIYLTPIVMKLIVTIYGLKLSINIYQRPKKWNK